MRRQRQGIYPRKRNRPAERGLRAFCLEYELQKGKTIEELAQLPADPGRTAIEENLKLQRPLKTKTFPSISRLKRSGNCPFHDKSISRKSGGRDPAWPATGILCWGGTLAESEKNCSDFKGRPFVFPGVPITKEKNPAI